ncbi:hypothetical protein D3C86_1750370 [compost metagenome]
MPEGAVVAHPVDERRQALGLGAVIDVAALRTLGDETRLFQRLEVLRNRALRHAAAARQFNDGDLVGIGDALEHGAPGRIGKGAHDGGDGSGFDHHG